jgi:hypothetical protein
MSTKTKTKPKTKKVVKKAPASKKKKAVKKVNKNLIVPQPPTPPIEALTSCGCYDSNECDWHDEDIANEYCFKDGPVKTTYYYAVNHTTKIKALITGEELPYDFAITIAERVTDDTGDGLDNIHVAPIGPTLYWVLKKIFKIKEYQI